MKKLIVFLLMTSLLFLAACNPADDNIEDPDPNPTPTDTEEPIGRDKTKVEIYYQQMLEAYNEHNTRDIIIVYMDESEIVFMNNVYVFYRYKNGVLEEHDVVGYDQTEPGIVRYKQSTGILYYTDSARYMYSVSFGSMEIKTYDFNVKAKGTFKTVKSILSLTGSHLITKTEDGVDIYNRNMTLVETVEDGYLLGYNNKPKSNQVAYAYIAVNKVDSCEIMVYLDKRIKTIQIPKTCVSAYTFLSNDEINYFIPVDGDEPRNLYRLNPESLEITQVNTQSQKIKEVSYDMSTYYSRTYIFTLEDDTQYAYTPDFNDDYSVQLPIENMMLLGNGFYVSGIDYKYEIFDYERNLISVIDPTTFNDRIWTVGDYFVTNSYSQDGTFIYYQTVYDKDGEVLISDVDDFVMIMPTRFLYRSNITKTSYDINIFDVEQYRTYTLYTNQHVEDLMSGFTEFYVTEDRIYVITEGQRHMLEFDYDANELEVYKFLGKTTYKGYSVLYLIDENGVLEEVVIP